LEKKLETKGKSGLSSRAEYVKGFRVQNALPEMPNDLLRLLMTSSLL
jgi:hypothetical protein